MTTATNLILGKAKHYGNFYYMSVEEFDNLLDAGDVDIVKYPSKRKQYYTCDLWVNNDKTKKIIVGVSY